MFAGNVREDEGRERRGKRKFRRASCRAADNGSRSCTDNRRGRTAGAGGSAEQGDLVEGEAKEAKYAVVFSQHPISDVPFLACLLSCTASPHDILTC